MPRTRLAIDEARADVEAEHERDDHPDREEQQRMLLRPRDQPTHERERRFGRDPLGQPAPPLLLERLPLGLVGTNLLGQLLQVMERPTGQSTTEIGRERPHHRRRHGGRVQRRRVGGAERRRNRVPRVERVGRDGRRVRIDSVFRLGHVGEVEPVRSTAISTLLCHTRYLSDAHDRS